MSQAWVEIIVPPVVAVNVQEQASSVVIQPVDVTTVEVNTAPAQTNLYVT